MEKQIIVKYWFSPNWGDIVNKELVRAISGITPKMIRITDRPGEENFMVIGSILRQADIHTIVWGSGFLNETNWFVDGTPPKKILAVRGPLTRNILLEHNVDCPEIYGDPALLLPRYYQPPTEKKYKLGIVMHWHDDEIQKDIEIPPNTIMIDWKVKNNLYEFVDKVNSCERIASSSLHGIICADAYHIPSIQIRFATEPEQFKYNDYFLSVRRPLKEPIAVSNKIDLDKILNSFYPYYTGIDLDKLFSVCPFKSDSSL